MQDPGLAPRAAALLSCLVDHGRRLQCPLFGALRGAVIVTIPAPRYGLCALGGFCVVRRE
jgi:hypothetical protein